MAKLALFGGTPVLQSTFPSWPVFDQREVESVVNVVNSGDWWMTNPAIADFESAFAKFQGSKYALSLTNGTHTLETILRALGIGPGDEVIVPAYTFIATASSVLMAGATPVLADVCIDTMTLDPERFSEAITSRTRAVITVHLGGVVGPVDDILRIAKAKKIFVVEDCAHAHGCASRGRQTGSLGIAGSFSFQSSKTMTSGEGGAIVTRDKSLFEKCWSLYNCGRKYKANFNEYQVLGSNYRMTPFQAAILAIQLQRMEEQSPVRLQSIQCLEEGLKDIEGITPQYRDPLDSAPGYLYSFYYDSKAFNGLSRSLFLKALSAEGIPCNAANYPAIHQTPLFRNRIFGAGGKAIKSDSTGQTLPDYASMSLPNAENIQETVVSLPHQVMLGELEQVQKAVEAIHKIQTHARKTVAPSLTWVTGVVRKKIGI
ncbi:DegT/DnrJ/EryC1/StrS family aminotransferase [Acaryochloris sp. IP29b_bin.137]|uniref:DegT/DnrJ/EryC1/StrS family aminotransferase n=1 Tax=Acaryochloris sp. IP29b_bin.137 TaxID=2969217 RepID=UPI0026072F1B|nr:DegT/DnrJ/EryC1/StrS family aminotransferase [Acaryochloris sp. IP29b_bin.137]